MTVPYHNPAQTISETTTQVLWTSTREFQQGHLKVKIWNHAAKLPSDNTESQQKWTTSKNQLWSSDMQRFFNKKGKSVVEMPPPALVMWPHPRVGADNHSSVAVVILILKTKDLYGRTSVRDLTLSWDSCCRRTWDITSIVSIHSQNYYIDDEDGWKFVMNPQNWSLVNRFHPWLIDSVVYTASDYWILWSLYPQVVTGIFDHISSEKYFIWLIKVNSDHICHIFWFGFLIDVQIVGFVPVCHSSYLHN
jgi:hypothetical protein